MIEHVVLFKFSDEAKISQAVEKLNALKAKIPQIIEMSAGKNFSDRGQGFQFGLRMLCRSKEDLQTYATHPAHLEVVHEDILPYKEDILVLDFER